MKKNNPVFGFTLIELIIVIVILGILAVIAAPRLIDLSSEAKIASINSIASQVRAAASMVQNKARVKGLKIAANAANQDQLIIDFGFGSAEVGWSNLCPESLAELGDRLTLIDFINLPASDQLQTRVDNQYALIGYQVPASGVPINEGCYLIYNSYTSPNCTVTVVDVDC